MAQSTTPPASSSASVSLELIADLTGHTEAAWSVAFNPTRNLLASCSTDRTIRLYSYILPSSTSSLSSKDSPKPVFSLLKSIQTEHSKSIRSIAWSPDGRSLASGSFDSTVGIWEEVIPLNNDNDDDENGNQGVDKPHHHHHHEHAEGEECDGHHSHSHGGGGDGDEEEPTWECVTTLEGHESECKSVAFSNDGALLASCSRDKSVWAWEVQPDADFECIAVMMEHTQDVKAIAWHPHEEILASASYDASIHLAFDDPDGDWTTFAHLHPKLPAQPLIIPSTSPELISAFSTPTPKEDETEVVVPPLEEDETVWCVVFSPCGKYMASGGDNGGIRIWSRKGTNTDSPFVEILHTIAHSRSIFSLSWSPSLSSSASSSSDGDGDLGLLASTGGDGKIIIWSLSTSEEATVKVEIKPLTAIKNAHGVYDVNSLQWCQRTDDTSKGRGMLVSSGDDGSVKVWRLISNV